MKKITNDLFNIANRIKQIDRNYFIVFNKKKLNYEVHNKKQIGGTLAFCIGKELNAFALKKAQLTSCKFAKKILKNLEEENFSLQQKQEQNFIDKHLETLNSYLNYANNKNTDVTF